MGPITADQLFQFGGSLGTGVLFVYLYFKERTENQKALKDKDGHIREINNKVLEAFESNASVNQALSDTIKENTKATQTLTDRVTGVLINKHTS